MKYGRKALPEGTPGEGVIARKERIAHFCVSALRKLELCALNEGKPPRQIPVRKLLTNPAIVGREHRTQRRNQPAVLFQPGKEAARSNGTKLFLQFFALRFARCKRLKNSVNVPRTLEFRLEGRFADIYSLTLVDADVDWARFADGEHIVDHLREPLESRRERQIQWVHDGARPRLHQRTLSQTGAKKNIYDSKLSPRMMKTNKFARIVINEAII